VANDYFVVIDQDFLDDEADQALPLSNIQRLGRRAQTGEKACDAFREPQPYFALRRVVGNGLQLRLICLFATSQIGAFSATREIAPERLLSASGRIGLARCPQAAVEFLLYEMGVFEQPHDFLPYDIIQQILTHWAVLADRPPEAAPSVRSQASIIVDGASARLRGGAVESVAAFRATHQTLYDAGDDGASRRVLLVGLQTLLGQCERLFADDRRHGNFDPLRAGKLVTGAVARGNAAAQP